MFPFILGAWNFLKSPLGRYLMIGLAAIVLVLSLRAHWMHQGHEEGKQEAITQTADENEKTRAAARQQATDAIKQADQALLAAQTRMNALSAQVTAQAQTIQVLAAQRQATAARVSTLADPEVHNFVIQTLALRKPGDLTGLGYTVAEEREIAFRVADDAQCKDQANKQADQIKTIQTQVENLQGQMHDMNVKYDALSSYTVTVEGDYTFLYNHWPRHSSVFLRVITFGLKGKPKKIPAPDPATLLDQKSKILSGASPGPAR